MELSRRFFLGGAISLLAANTFVPSASASGNLPHIWGDGKHDDTSGLGALFRKEPVIFSNENLGVDEHEGILFHTGRYKVTGTIELPAGLRCKVESSTFDLTELDAAFPVFRGRNKELTIFTGLYARYVEPVSAERRLNYTESVSLPATEEDIVQRELEVRQELERDRQFWRQDIGSKRRHIRKQARKQLILLHNSNSRAIAQAQCSIL